MKQTDDSVVSSTLELPIKSVSASATSASSDSVD